MDAETSIDAESLMIDDPFIDDTTEYDSYLASQASTNDDSSRLYDWLADSRSTNHITNRREIFTTYCMKKRREPPSMVSEAKLNR
jgi:hypothetical protein